MNNEALNQGKTTNPPAIEAATTNLRKPTGSTTTSGMNVAAPVSVGPMKPVDSKTLEGSYAGDHRAPANKADLTASFKNQNGPRGETNDTELAGS